MNINLSLIISCGVFVTGGGSGALTCCLTCFIYMGSSFVMTSLLIGGCIDTALGFALGFGFTCLSSVLKHL